MALFARYPRLARFRTEQDYEGVIIAQPEPGVGVIVYIPPFVETTGIFANLELFDRVTVTNSQVEPYEGSVILNGSKDPTIGP